MEAQPALDARLDVAIEAAHAAGQVLRQGFQSGEMTYTTKSNQNDVVTAFDLRAEKVIVETLRSSFPEDSLLTEEQESAQFAEQGQWVIDPLDGTNNFSQQVPHFAVSIAFCDRYTPMVACIYDPIRDELFTAIRGNGAHRNSTPLHVSAQFELEGSFLGVGTSIHPVLRENMHRRMSPFLQTARALRTTGSAALDLAYVAAGRFDAAWYPELHWWDIAAGILLVTEAGGRCTNYEGEAPASALSSIVASNGPLHERIRGHLFEEPRADE